MHPSLTLPMYFEYSVRPLGIDGHDTCRPLPALACCLHWNRSIVNGVIFGERFTVSLYSISPTNTLSYLLEIVAFFRGFAIDPNSFSRFILQYLVNSVPLHFAHHLPHRGALIFAIFPGLGPREEGVGIGDDLVFEVFRTNVHTRETVLRTILSQSRVAMIHASLQLQHDQRWSISLQLQHDHSSFGLKKSEINIAV